MSSAEMFALFYSEYPRHVARKAAEKAWNRVDMTDELFNTIMLALASQKETAWKCKDSRYIPHAASWLNGERWNDEIEAPQPSRQDQAFNEPFRQVLAARRNNGS